MVGAACFLGGWHLVQHLLVAPVRTYDPWACNNTTRIKRYGDRIRHLRATLHRGRVPRNTDHRASILAVARALVPGTVPPTSLNAANAIHFRDRHSAFHLYRIRMWLPTWFVTFESTWY